MTNLRIVFKNPDGTCGVVIPAPKAVFTIEELIMTGVPGFRELVLKDENKREIESPQDAFNRIGEVELQKIRPYRITTTDKLPADRTFRDAWTDDFDTDTVDIHMDKARDVHMDRIRNARAKKFEEMGFPVKLHPSLEEAVIPQETRDKLQALRDIPSTINLSEAQTPEELKAMWPEELDE